MSNNSPKDNISVSLDAWLIEELDRACAETFLSRSDFIRRAVRREILMSKVDDRTFWEEWYLKHSENG